MCRPALQYSVDLRTQTYTEPAASLKCGKLAPKNIRGYTDIFYSVTDTRLLRLRVIKHVVKAVMIQRISSVCFV